jgi:hypothetical protein
MHKPEAGGQALNPADWTDDEDMDDQYIWVAEQYAGH